MAVKSINRQVLSLAGPSILANITVPLVGIVDLAISGHVGDAAAMGGIAIGSMLFDLLYWNMGFLRAGTGGITAQAYGRRDTRAQVDTFSQGMVTALASGLFFILIQWVFVNVAFRLIDCSPEVEAFARQYFSLRIWAAPATLSLFVFKGWFIGMQNTVYSMIVDIWVNVANIIASWLLAFRTPLGIAGVAVGTVVAQWTGFILASTLMAYKYSGLLKEISVSRSIKWKYIKAFFSVNADLFIRALAFQVVYAGFTSIAAKFGDVQLAVSSVMMKLLLFYSYFLDGLAYAGEALTGRFIGERNEADLRSSVKVIFFWGFVVSLFSTLVYLLFPETMISVITSDSEVLEACRPYLFWLWLMPFISSIAFVWDGIYIGATASAPLRNCMLISAALFILTYIFANPIWGMQSLYLAYFVHLAYRSVHLTITYKSRVLSRLNH